MLRVRGETLTDCWGEMFRRILKTIKWAKLAILLPVYFILAGMCLVFLFTSGWVVWLMEDKHDSNDA